MASPSPSRIAWPTGWCSTEGEDRHDVEIGAGLLAARRASFFGRGPCVYDVEVALGLFGFLAPAPEDLIEYRRILFQAVGHQWMAQRALVDWRARDGTPAQPGGCRGLSSRAGGRSSASEAAGLTSTAAAAGRGSAHQAR